MTPKMSLAEIIATHTGLEYKLFRNTLLKCSVDRDKRPVHDICLTYMEIEEPEVVEGVLMLSNINHIIAYSEKEYDIMFNEDAAVFDIEYKAGDPTLLCRFLDKTGTKPLCMDRYPDAVFMPIVPLSLLVDKRDGDVLVLKRYDGKMKFHLTCTMPKDGEVVNKIGDFHTWVYCLLMLAKISKHDRPDANPLEVVPIRKDYLDRSRNAFAGGEHKSPTDWDGIELKLSMAYMEHRQATGW